MRATTLRQAVVVTLEQPVTGWRPRDLAAAYSRPLRGHGLADNTSDPVFRSRLAQPPEQDPQATMLHWLQTWSHPLT